MANNPVSHAPTVPAHQNVAADQEPEVVLKMPKDILIQLSELSGLLDIDPSDALRYALTSTIYLYKQRKEGAEVVLDKDRKRYKVEWLTPQEFAKSSSGAM